MDSAAIVGKYIVNAEYRNLPLEAVQATKQYILHTLATIIGGSSVRFQ